MINDRGKLFNKLIWLRRAGLAGAILLAAAIAMLDVKPKTVPASRIDPTFKAALADEAVHFVGAAACAGCHEKETAAWRGSHHALAMQVANDGTVLGDFSDARSTYYGVTSHFFRRAGKFFVNTDRHDGNWPISRLSTLLASIHCSNI
jgi:Cytochrome c554 and c-prime